MYIYHNLTYADIECATGVPIRTIRSWKNRALLKKNDDWDKARHINSMSQQSVDTINRQVYADWLTKFKKVQTAILNDMQMDALGRVSALTSLADSFNKMVAAMRKIEPDVNIAAIALKVLTIITDYFSDTDSDLANNFTQHIDPIGVRIQKEFTT